jgi:hypothetical protein
VGVALAGVRAFATGPLLKCADCDERRLVAFSCKGRGFCPSCLGRRMCATVVVRRDGAGGALLKTPKLKEDYLLDAVE